MKRELLIILIISWLLLLTGTGIPAEPTNKEYRIPSVKTGIKTDGLLNEEVWKQALTLELKYEVSPGENIKPLVRTEVLLAYGKSHLYIAFRAYDPDPSQLNARICDRDNINGQDLVSVDLDTFNDERRSFGFGCNPYGVQSDYVETTDSYDSEWDAIWDSGGRVTNEGYVVEMSIPFSSLRFQRIEGEQVWGIDAIRKYPRSLTHEMGLFPRDRNNDCYLCQAVKIRGFKGAKPGKNIELDPTLSTHASWEREDFLEGPFKLDKKLEPGLTARWGFTPNLTLSATVNPDFSQVEADAVEMDINEPFALFYPEKRPFFNEGADYFNTRMDAVYTRTVRDPSWGVKITGKEKGNTIGAFIVRDTLTNLLFPGTQSSSSTSLEMDSTASVLRYRRDLGSNSTLGVLFTNREGENYYNRVYGVDGDIRVTAKDRIQVQALGSTTRYPDEVATEFQQETGKFNDKALDIYYRHNARNLDWHLTYNDIGADFRTDLGFITQVGYRSLLATTEYTWYGKPNHWWSRFKLDGQFEQKNNHDGHRFYRHFITSLTYMGPKLMHSILEYKLTEEEYNGIKFDQKRFFLHHCMRPIGDIHFYFNTLFGDRIDYANTRPGKRLYVKTGLTYNMGLHLKWSFDHTFERLWVNSERLYTANISALNLVYQFDKRTFLRTVLQYVDYRYNSDNYTFEINPVYKHLFTQLLFSYKINPQTVLFLGYSDNYYGYKDTGFPQVNRKVFLKIGYALVM
ncbi:MAG: carbohydrate binding family 9 domain-containing protein [bacterium]|nr:carbohydrate binding family 9 domain-containing protein [bacterium]